MNVPTQTYSYNESDGLITYYGWAGVISAAKTLSFTATLTMQSARGSSYVSASYTLDGSTWTQIFAVTAPFGSTPYSIAIPAGQDLSKVQVQFASNSSADAASGSTAPGYANASLTVSNLQIA